MIDETSLPYSGDEIDGYRATISTGLKPRFWRYHLHDGNWRAAYLFLFIVTPLGLLPLGLGIWILGHVRRLKPMLMGITLIGIGGLMLLLGPLIALGLVWMARKWVKHFRHGLLIPGIVVSSKPLVLLGLADLGKAAELKGREFGLARDQVMSLPNHPHEVGTWVPCVASFSEVGRDRFFYFTPYPVSHGTGDEFDLEQCVQRLGPAAFRRLEALIAGGVAPEDQDHMVIIDANNEVVEIRSQDEARDMRRAEEDEQAGN